MQEIEVKILEIDVNAIQKKLKQLGARKVFEGPMLASRFDTPTDELEEEGKMLRLRQRGEITELTLKKKPQGEEDKNAKVREEIELTVSDYATMKMILASIGLVESGIQEKHRISYALGDDVHIEIDTFPNLPTFLEIEAHSIKKIEEVVSLLGFTMEDTKPWSGKKVLEHYAQKRRK
ncbi:class IV adenylate cyclase [Candidatus Woesearchaeota archaeon]|nr:class IV adenylate cyclase [Candidatus Woesearchaeota archaeon]